jgi:phage terminase large subunit
METQTAERETRQVMAELYKSCRQDPVFFVEWALGHMTWSKQREILRSVRDNERTAVRASHGVSKTFAAAEAAIWFLNCIPNSKVITTAPTWTQMAKLLWSEIGADYARSRIELEGECLMTEIKTDEKDHYAIGFSTDTPARAEGWHAPSILFIFDEAKGIPQWLWDAVRGSMTGGLCRWLAISTTDGVQVGEQYHKIFTTENHGWNRIHISAYDTPYVTGEKFRTIEIPDPARPDIFRAKQLDPKDVVIQIATPKYINECRQEWGEDSPLYQTKVLGEISDAGADSIIKLSQVEQMKRNAANEAFDATGQEEGGVDVARGGTDDTVMFHRKGLKVTEEKVLASPQLPEKAKLVFIADEVKRFFSYNKQIPIKVDDTGVGGGVTDILQADGYNIVPINFGAEANEPDKYPNTISEMWFEVGKIIHEISCPASGRLQAELVNRKQKQLDKKGRRVVESKDDYKGRGFRSPDKADAFLLTFYNPQNVVNIRSLRS